MKEWIKQNHGKMLTGTKGARLFIFNWPSLSEEQQASLIDFQLLAVANQILSEKKKLAEVFSQETIPFALLGPEDGLEPEEILDFFDAQCMGVLLWKDNIVLSCESSASSLLKTFTLSPSHIMAEFVESE